MNISIFRQALSGLTHLFYPELCEGCGDELQGQERILCLHCNMLLPRTAYHHIAGNKTFQVFTGRVPIEKATSFVFFTKAGLIQQILHRFKYKGRKDIGKYLGMLFAEELKKSSWMDTIDMIVAVPLHSGKAYQRGYNQAACFAEGIAGVSGKSLCSNAVVRVKKTETQTRKTRAQRMENVRNVFAVRKPGQIRNKHILLVDDVLTTGATLEACALALLQTEGVSISIATIAIATD